MGWSESAAHRDRLAVAGLKRRLAGHQELVAFWAERLAAACADDGRPEDRHGTGRAKKRAKKD